MSELDKIAKEFHSDCKEFLNKLLSYRKRLCKICRKQEDCPAREGLDAIDEEVTNRDFPVLEELVLFTTKHLCEEIALLILIEATTQ